MGQVLNDKPLDLLDLSPHYNDTFDHLIIDDILDLNEVNPDTWKNNLLFDDDDMNTRLLHSPSQNECVFPNSLNIDKYNPLLQVDFVHTTTGPTPPDTPPSSDRSTPPTEEISTSNLLISSSDCSISCNTPVNQPFITFPIFSSDSIKEHNVTITSNNPNVINTININNRYSNNKIKKLPPISPKVSNVNTSQVDKLTLSALKKEARKLRNRESANISRKKKKEYLDSLESKVSSLTEQNLLLREENDKLRKRIYELEKESNDLRSHIFSDKFAHISKKKASIGLLAVFFLLTLKLPSFNGIFFTLQDTSTISIKDFRGTGRALLWDDTKMNDFNHLSTSDGFNTKKTFYLNSSLNPDCLNFNQTEFMRIEKELRGWLTRFEKEKVNNNQLKISQAIRNRHNKKSLSLSRVKWFGNNDESFPFYLSKTYNLAISYNDLVKAIDPRDDTFYFLSFASGDQFLLPPEAKNSTIRPRFSIVMPTLNQINSTAYRLNGTYQLTAMQIDCEIMNMKMLSVANLFSPNHVQSTIKRRLRRHSSK